MSFKVAKQKPEQHQTTQDRTIIYTNILRYMYSVIVYTVYYVTDMLGWQEKALRIPIYTYLKILKKA